MVRGKGKRGNREYCLLALATVRHTILLALPLSHLQGQLTHTPCSWDSSIVLPWGCAVHDISGAAVGEEQDQFSLVIQSVRAMPTLQSILASLLLVVTGLKWH